MYIKRIMYILYMFIYLITCIADFNKQIFLIVILQ